MISLDLKIGPITENKFENIFLLILSLNVIMIKKKKINYNRLYKIIYYFKHFIFLLDLKILLYYQFPTKL